MGIIDARIGGKLRAGQFATLPGTVKCMLQDRSLANQFIQGTQGLFGSHNVACFGGCLQGRTSKKFVAGLLSRQPSSTANTHGVAVIHIVDASKAEPHPFSSAARIVDGKLSYSRNQQEFLQALTISSSLSQH